jgi:hypothetical protein
LRKEKDEIYRLLVNDGVLKGQISGTVSAVDLQIKRKSEGKIRALISLQNSRGFGRFGGRGRTRSAYFVRALAPYKISARGGSVQLLHEESVSIPTSSIPLNNLKQVVNLFLIFHHKIKVQMPFSIHSPETYAPSCLALPGNVRAIRRLPLRFVFQAYN